MQAGGLLLREVRLIDGTGGAARLADVAVAGDRVVAIAPPGRGAASGGQVIAGDGRVLAPGFIDTHTHDDLAVLDTPEMLPKVSQGVTTVVTGNCGISAAPLTLEAPPPEPINLLGGQDAFRFPSFAAYAEAVTQAAPAVNVAALIGHGSLRVGSMADVGRRADEGELAAMQARLAEGLAQGAIGLSSGLFYAPNKAADMGEVVALARPVGAAGGVYVTHMRDEHDGVAESIGETVETARRAGVPVVISHHKCAGPANWGRSVETLELIAAARDTHPVGLDAYPYAAGSTVLDPAMVDPEVPVLVTWSDAVPAVAGRMLADIAADWGCGAADAAQRLVPAGAIYFSMDEADVRRILAFPSTMIGSDGLPRDAHPHPRLWGTFARVAGHYARDVGLFSLEAAVHKMSGLTAATFGLAGRGVIREGGFADLVLFDADKIDDQATFEAPTRRAAGIDLVVVNGVVAYDGEAVRGRAGRLLKRG